MIIFKLIAFSFVLIFSINTPLAYAETGALKPSGKLPLPCVGIPGKKDPAVPCIVSTDVPYKVVSAGRQIELDNQQIHIVHNESQMAYLMVLTEFSEIIPSIDYTVEDLVVIIEGSHGNSQANICDRLSVRSVVDTGPSILINVIKHLVPPINRCLITSQPDTPYIMVSIPKTKTFISVNYTAQSELPPPPPGK
ncbi:MAG: hypothetical protein ACC657_10070 [Thiohalomonadales bacterium]